MGESKKPYWRFTLELVLMFACSTGSAAERHCDNKLSNPRTKYSDPGHCSKLEYSIKSLLIPLYRSQLIKFYLILQLRTSKVLIFFVTGSSSVLEPSAISVVILKTEEGNYKLLYIINKKIQSVVNLWITANKL